MRFTHVALAGALALSTFSMTPSVAFAQSGHQTQLSQCMRNGLIGAGVGAAIGALSSSHHRGQRAIIGAAVGGVGTWGVCRILSANDRNRVENGYQRSLASNHSYNDTWSDNDSERSLHVNRPQTDYSAGSNCKTVHATIDDGQNGRQELPPETYCRNSSGQWIPA